MVARLSSLVFAVLIAASTAAAAATTPARSPNPAIQLMKVTCGDMLASDVLDRSSIMMFYWGYLAGKQGATVLNTSGLELATSRVMEVCTAHQSMTLFDAIDAAKRGNK
ncbi:MAG: hypothetical protein JOY86_02015 [Candidatus Eremiobacteraeota bacterium]|nr:hypothetical protein [Candidatus Eremiobacteraeota bacterium]MBV8365710.1 hypothetical protein [Candidatus Eremiobacteraeota bacterium]